MLNFGTLQKKYEIYLEMSCDITPPSSEVDVFLENRLKDADVDKIAIVLVGGPGSGKSGAKIKTVQLLGKQLSNFVNIDPDEILTTLFDNNTNCYDKVSVINNKSYEMAIEQNKNIIFDGTGRNFEWYSTNVIKRLKDLDYVVNLVIVMNEADIVLNRIAERARQTGRHVNTTYMKSVYFGPSTLRPRRALLVLGISPFALSEAVMVNPMDSPRRHLRKYSRFR